MADGGFAPLPCNRDGEKSRLLSSTETDHFTLIHFAPFDQFSSKRILKINQKSSELMQSNDDFNDFEKHWKYLLYLSLFSQLFYPSIDFSKPSSLYGRRIYFYYLINKNPKYFLSSLQTTSIIFRTRIHTGIFAFHPSHARFTLYLSYTEREREYRDENGRPF